MVKLKLGVIIILPGSPSLCPRYSLWRGILNCVPCHSCFGTVLYIECNSSNWDIVPTLLLQFLKPGMWSEACFAHSAGCPSIAVLLGAAHPLRGNTKH